MIDRELSNYLETVKSDQRERRLRLDELLLSDRYVPSIVIVKMMEEIRWYDKYIQYKSRDLTNT
jgi:hypothetical protein